MTAAKKTAQEARDDGQPDPEAAELELARPLAERARAEGLQLTGPGWLLGRLTKVVLEGALEGELDAHLGYARHDLRRTRMGETRSCRLSHRTWPARGVFQCCMSESGPLASFDGSSATAV